MTAEVKRFIVLSGSGIAFKRAARETLGEQPKSDLGVDGKLTHYPTVERMHEV